MMFLLGRQAMLWHEPPIYLRSISATRFPCSANVHAAIFDPVPLPRTTRSYSSRSVLADNCPEETVSMLSIRVFPTQRDLNVPFSSRQLRISEIQSAHFR